MPKGSDIKDDTKAECRDTLPPKRPKKEQNKSDSNKKPRLSSNSGGGRGGANTSGNDLLDFFSSNRPEEPLDESSKAACEPTARKHSSRYHHTVLFEESSEGTKARTALLDWFDGVRTSRSMPWRKDWIDPSSIEDKEQLRELLKRRAYEVWISEIMLQQTRVTTVISYWNNWMAKWPTIEDLARAQIPEVLNAWRGLGYYSRATRIHAAAHLVVDSSETRGLLPETADLLQRRVPGIGRYTGGAIAAIVFGNAAPMVDGNVLRVLSRQLGIYGDVKSSKKVIDLLWIAADDLVKQVAADGKKNKKKNNSNSSITKEEESRSDDGKAAEKSERPGLWGQALMELGSTICTPNPTCRSCPIKESCRAYGEGVLLASRQGLLPKGNKLSTHLVLPDIEDLCSVCEPFEGGSSSLGESNEAIERDAPKIESNRNGSKVAPRKQMTLSAFAFTKAGGGGGRRSSSSTGTAVPVSKQENGAAVPAYSDKVYSLIESHAKRFPMKVVKKAVREESTVVCAVRNSQGQILLHQRPDKGER